MNTYGDNKSETLRQAVANNLIRAQTKGESSIQFVDNRPRAIAQRKLQEAADDSSQVKQFQAYQRMANISPHTSKAEQMPSMMSISLVQKKSIEEEEPIQQKKEKVVAPFFGDASKQTTQDNLVQRKENNTGLPDTLKTGIENLSGISLNDVKVHYNSDKPTQLQTHAYAQGTDIHLGSGQEKHLPHEAWHVVQQKQGRVKPTVQLKGNVNVNDDNGLEEEADVMGSKALNLSSPNIQQVSKIRSENSTSEHTVQRTIMHVNLLINKYTQLTGVNYGLAANATWDAVLEVTWPDINLKDSLNKMYSYHRI